MKQSAIFEGRQPQQSFKVEREQTMWDQDNTRLQDSTQKIILHNNSNMTIKQSSTINSTSVRLIGDQLIANNTVQITMHGKMKVFDTRALFVLSYKNPFRRAVIWIIEWKVFEYFIISMIILNSISLALYDYSDRNSTSKKNQILDDIGNGFTIIFAIECLLKIIGMGFIVHKKSYLRDGWNFIDFFVVLSGILDLLPMGSVNLKSLRVLRVLRPLRSINAIPGNYSILNINHFKAMKQQVGALIKALPDFANVAIFLMFVFMLFAILGLHQYNGIMYNRCRLELTPNMTTGMWYMNETEVRVCSNDTMGQFMCAASEICGNPLDFDIPLSLDDVQDNQQINYGIYTFDHIGKAILTVFNILTTDGWSSIMYNLIDADIPFIAVIFCCLIVVLGSFFMLNLILAVIIQAYFNFQQSQTIEDLENLYVECANEEEVNNDDMANIDQQEQELKIQDQTKGDRTFTSPKRLEVINELAHEENQAEKNINISSLNDDVRYKFIQKHEAGSSSLVKEGSKTTNLQTADNLIKQSDLDSLTKSHVNPDLSFLKPITMKQRVLLAFKTAEQEHKSEESIDFEDEQDLKNQTTNKIKMASVIEINIEKSPIREISEKKPSIRIDEGVKTDTLLAPNKRMMSIRGMPENNLKIKRDISQLFGKNNKDSYTEQKNSIQAVTSWRELNSIQNSINKFKLSRKNAQLQSQFEKFKVEHRAEQNRLYYFMWKLQKSKPFQVFISLIIVGNTCILAMDRYPITPQETQINNTINIAFTLIFFLEMLVKLAGLGFRTYYKDAFNIFDSIIVYMSLLDLSLTYGLKASSGSAGRVLTAFRGFRLLRIFKLAKHWDQFQLVLKTVQKSFKEVSTFSIILFLFMYIYALLGLELFAYKAKFNDQGQVDMVNGTDPTINFNNLFDAIITVFIVLTNDGWSSIYFNYYRTVGAATSSLYFLTLIVIGQKILLNLFLAILLRNFDEAQLNQEEKRAKDQKKKAFKDSRMNTEEKEASKSIYFRLFQRAREFFNEKIKSKHSKVHSLSADTTQGNESNSQLQNSKKRRRSRFKKSSESSQSSVYDENDADLALMGKALYIFPDNNTLRKLIYKLVTNMKFEIFLMCIILTSCVQLSLENPLNDPNGSLTLALFYVDIVTTIIFTLESILKIIAYGAIFNGSKSYLRNYWNIIDFLIVIFSLAAFSNKKSLKIFKMFRVLRPLRVISRNQGLKTAVVALVMAVPHIVSIILIVLLFFLIFGIIGISFFKGKYYYCDTDIINFDMSFLIINSKWDCLNSGGLWKNTSFSFDNIFAAIATLFQLASTSGWSVIMETSVGTTQINYVQIPGYQPYWALFFIAFVIIGAFFLLNLFVGVVVLRFQNQKNQLTGQSLLTQGQQVWVDIKVQNLKAKPIKVRKPPINKVRRFLYDMQKKKAFDNCIFVCIVLNTIILPVKWYGQPDITSQITDSLNYGFTIIFTIEAIIKIIALGLHYFKEGWNVFDFVIALGSLGSIFISQNTSLNLGGATSIIRAFRVGRILKLIKRAKSLKIVFNTFLITLPALANVGGLLMLLLYLYSILGVFLFADIAINGVLTDTMNFQTFAKAFLTLFVVATGDGWNDIMNSILLDNSDIVIQCLDNPAWSDYQANGYQTVGCGQSGIGYAFFYSYYLLVNLIFLNLFIAIILDGFSYTQCKEKRVVNQDTLIHFREVWSQFDPDATSFIKISQLKDFMFELGPPLGFGHLYKDSKFMQDKYIAKLDLPVYNNFQDYNFMEVLEALSLNVIIREQTEDKINEEKKQQDSIMSEKSEDNHSKERNQDSRMQQEVEHEINQIAFSQNISGIQALKEMKKGERRQTLFKQNLNRDNHFSSIHQAAAEVVYNQLKYVVTKNKLVKKVKEQIDKDYQEEEDQKNLELLSSERVEQKQEVNNSFEEGKYSKKESLNQTQSRFELTGGQLIMKQLTKKNSKLNNITFSESRLSEHNTSKNLGLRPSNNTSKKSSDISFSEIEQIIAQEQDRQLKGEFGARRSSSKIGQRTSSKANSRCSKYMQQEIDIGSLNLSSPEIRQVVITDPDNKQQINNNNNNNNNNFRIKRPPKIAVIPQEKRKNMPSMFKTVGGTMGGTGEEDNELNIDDLKKEVEMLLLMDNSPLKLSPAKLKKYNKQQSNISDIISSEITKILERKQTRQIIDQVQNGEDVSLKELQHQIFRNDSFGSYDESEENNYKQEYQTNDMLYKNAMSPTKY